MKDSYFIDCLDKFHDLPDQIQEMIGGFDVSLKVKNLEEKYGLSLSFVVILVSIGELTIDDIPDYLNLKFGLDKIKGEEIADKLEEEIFSSVLDYVLENTELTEEEVETEAVSDSPKFGPIVNLSTEEKKELILKTFSGNLIPALQAEPVKIQDFNIAIFQAFQSDDILEDKAENLLYINQEKLSDHHIILDGHPASPTVANWLKDFIKKYGSSLFDDVALAEYLTQSPNVKLLKPEEKELLRRVLKLYRNLSFFPESMDGVPIEEWEVFPLDRSKLDHEQLVKKPIIIDSAPSITTEKQKVIFDLQKSLAKYSSASLEHKALTQEINRLSKK